MLKDGINAFTNFTYEKTRLYDYEKEIEDPDIMYHPVYLMICIYHIIYGCPIRIPIEAMENVRTNFCYWMMKGNLPI